MLVLARRSNQSIMVGDLIEIKIIEVKGDQVKIGIEAPKNITVHRKEIYEDIKEANILASKNNDLTQIQQISALSQQLRDNTTPNKENNSKG